MVKEKRVAEVERERLRQEELKNHVGGNLRDSYERSTNGSLVDLVGSLGWKGTGLLILVAIIVYFVLFILD